MSGCVDELQLPIRQVEPRLVVEGLITTDPPPYSIKLTFSGRYNSAYELPEGLLVNGAVVTINDDQGHSVRLRQDPLAPAYYFVRDTTFRGKAGRRYTLHIRLDDGRQYVSSPELLTDVPPIEQLTAEYQSGASGLPQPSIYRVLLDTRDPITPGNYYRWSALAYSPIWQNGVPKVFESVTVNACLTTTYGPLTDVLSDALINGNRISRRPVLDAPIYGTGRHYVEVQQYSLTRAAYQYWTRFEEQRTRTGSLFDAQPASIEGNVHQQTDTTIVALGYFGASTISRKRLVIPGDTINYGRFIVRYGGLFKGNCSVVPSDAELENWTTN
ncbi:DUF4249 domain-containing protein [Spirosoma arboris]|uniref:DUF4249 domain-containing protein n=1 Tax=Spirosoma arboris TaxID=2682092 RepID=UPI001D129262|nr:DUF4249 domain-containing protein [Spirosoma arboris]